MTTSARTQGTRARLLAAARTEFAEHGMGGARVDRIAVRAGANKERIYGYFGSKEKLFTAVVAEALNEHAVRVGLPDGDPGEYAGRMYDYHLSNPELTRMLMWEALHYGDRAVPDTEVRIAHYERKAAALAESTDGRLAGDAAATFLALIGVAVWPLAFPQMARLVLGAGEGPPDADALRAHVVETARKLAPPRPGDQGLRATAT
ncbi:MULTISPECIES: TetR family transcriptional regulator [unclassified Streptomyces]|uniref:TetR family transcriptional regulator n=1 Tax=unclassified Streptomyces TaxID=2593676 RepID=UPI002E10F315|nr:TetR family transcriptional regulator [Streptomyces sp. NBC_01197]WSS51810.1 TetR family transcriptional regulator [Streptomyces sp. NBC_01180]